MLIKCLLNEYVPNSVAELVYVLMYVYIYLQAYAN